MDGRRTAQNEAPTGQKPIESAPAPVDGGAGTAAAIPPQSPPDGRHSTPASQTHSANNAAPGDTAAPAVTSPQIRQYELVERVKAYDPHADEDLLNRAYVFAMRAHGAQTRLSGDPYFSHPLEVAAILTGLKVDPATIATALLHDTLEDTGATYAELQGLFGEDVARLVDGVTKLSQVELKSSRSKQAENFRKFLIALSKDVRVLLVKLADRLHNMRTLGFIQKPEKRRRIAFETMELYAPLAGRLGVQTFREELEDLAFAELNPSALKSITRRLDYLRGESGEDIFAMTDRITSVLQEAGIEATVSCREKRPYSIWRKMTEKNVSFEQLADIFAFRVIVQKDEECYRALGVIHGEWPVLPGRFKDYISTPKPNNYRSLHTAVIGPDGQRLEIQIRTEGMQATADRGVAAHWRYKDPDVQEGARGGIVIDHAGGPKGHDPYVWLQSVVQMLEHGDDAEEFLENAKLELFQDQVFCFTPRGRLISLPRGATPVDFAYAIHTDIGDTCVGAKINGTTRPLRTALRNGDMVEIIRSQKTNILPNWESLALTGKARSGLRRLVRKTERAEYEHLGKEILANTFGAEDLALSDKGLTQAASHLGADDPEALYEKVGRGDVSAGAVLNAVYPGHPAREASAMVRPSHKPAIGPDDTELLRRARAIPIKGLTPGVAVHFAPCCSPLPGDRIVGVPEANKGVVIHTIDCNQLDPDDPDQENWLDLAWRRDASEEVNAVGRLLMTLRNTPGSLGEVSTIIARYGGNIINIRMANRELDFFELMSDIEVSDVRHLAQITGALRASHSVIAVDRPKR